ncbi:MAG: DUF86 domain-containing protein [Elusimicrobia bacterium]|nr:DUF86 domain-containing protein [Candidatus Liberimonas magnetica]
MLKNIKNDLVYLLNILESIEKIYIYTKYCKSADELYRRNDQLNFNAALTLLTQIGENVNKISDELKKKHKINWAEIKAFRNRITHEYTGIDIFVVFGIIKKDLKLLEKKLCKIVKEQLNKNIFDKAEINAANDSEYYKHINFESFL